MARHRRGSRDSEHWLQGRAYCRGAVSGRDPFSHHGSAHGHVAGTRTCPTVTDRALRSLPNTHCISGGDLMRDPAIEQKVIKIAQELIDDDRSDLSAGAIQIAVDRALQLHAAWADQIDREAVVAELIRRFS